MAAITDWADYTTRHQSARESVSTGVTAFTMVTGRAYSAWTTNVPAIGVAPTTAIVPSRTQAGSLLQQNAGTEQLFITGAEIGMNTCGLWWLSDRLSHQGGLSGTATTAQTTNLPTAALTRYTSGEGVRIALEIYTIVGTTATTVAVSYTNQAGTAGRVSPLTTFGGTAYREARAVMFIPLMAGDTGVRSVESVTLTATTDTVGNFGVTLFKPLVGFMLDKVNLTHDFNLADGGMIGGMPEILDDACLYWQCIPDRTGGALTGTLNLTAV